MSNNDAVSVGNTKDWMYKTVMDWRNDIQEYSIRNLPYKMSMREHKLLDMIQSTLEYLEEHSASISAHYKYQLNGQLNCMFYELENLLEKNTYGEHN